MGKPVKISDCYQPHAQQVKFHSSPAVYRLYGGAKGGGKSVALLWEAIGWCLKIPGCNVLLLRRTFPELKKGLLRHFELLVAPAIYGGRKRYNQASGFVHFPNGSKLYFGSCQHEKDVMGYNGHEYVFIGIDEATEWTYDMFEYLSFQNRCPIKSWTDSRGEVHGVTPCMALATNPGGPGHEWIKALFIGEKNEDGRYVRTLENIRKKIPQMTDVKMDDYAFISAKIFDNPAYAKDKKYLEKLESANAVWKERYLYGSWEMFEGAYFEKFDPALSVMDKYMAKRLVHGQPWHPKWIGIDWGYRHWAAVYFFSNVTTTDQEGKQTDRVICYDEIVCQGTGSRELGALIAKKCKWQDETGKEYPTNIQAIYISPDAREKRDSENTVADKIDEALSPYKLPRVTNADDDRVGGARLIDEMLSRRPDPDLLISEECEELIDAIPTLQVDDKNSEDVQKTKLRSDDIYDAFRYGLKSMIAAGNTPFAVERERLMGLCKTNQEKFWTDMALKQRRKNTQLGIRFFRPRSFGRA
jgi:phage terminase large subunit